MAKPAPRESTMVWFRRDLRTEDHAALAAASERRVPVVGLFVDSPGMWRLHDDAPIKVAFWRDGVRSLGESLAQLGIPLVVRRADESSTIPRVVAAAAAACGSRTIHATREYEINEASRDTATAAELARQGAVLALHHDSCILEPGSVRTKNGGPFSVFTPFKNAWLEEAARRPLQLFGSPRKQAALAVGPSEPMETVGSPPGWVAGEREAHRRLSEFIDKRIDGYGSNRDRADVDGTSVLSPYLAAGMISARRCLAAAVEANDGRLSAEGGGAATWINELIWREFFKHLLVAFPRVCRGRAFRPGADRIAWREDPGAFDSWASGHTGYPIVDAAMRCLAATGWMHNRLRMITAMFLTKHLLLDWRLGERHFMRHLVDGDLAANNGGWQWSAGTGADAAPYFRIFNPVTQSRKTDPEGAFIRRWVPELACVQGEEIHAPWELPALPRARLDYHAPIVEHALARARALAAFKSLAAER